MIFVVREKHQRNHSMDYLLRCIADHGRRGELGITDLGYSPGSVPQYLPDLEPIP